MGAALLGWIASAALGFCAENAGLSLTSALALIWLALAPLVRVDGAARSASLVVACSAPYFAFGVVADHAAGAAWQELAVRATCAAAWCAGLAASGASACERRRGGVWLAAYFAAVCAVPLVSLALAMGGDGAEWSVVKRLEGVSPLAWAARALPQSTASFDAWGALLAPAVLPTTAVVALAWLARRGPAPEARIVAPSSSPGPA
jgi:hypothetical protein